MTGRRWLLVVWALVAAASGCRERNPAYCQAHYMDEPDCPQPGGPCDSAGECVAPTPVCNGEIMTCVECMEDRHCRTAQPFCEQNACIECRTDVDCASGLCLDDQTCARPEDVAYVDGAADMANPCTRMQPCPSLDKALKLMPPPRYIKATGMLVDDRVLNINRSVTVYGDPGRTQISRSMAGEVLTIKGMGSPDVTLQDLEIVGNPSSNDKHCVEISETARVTMTRVNVHDHGEAGISMSMTARLVLIESQIHDNGEEGLKALAGTTLELRHSSVYKNNNKTSGTSGILAMNAAMVTIDSSTIAKNDGPGGGVSITGPFSIRNSIISANGNVSTTTSAGGLTLNPVVAGNAKFEFNTVADNASSSTTTGLACSTVQFDVSNSIFTNNAVNNCNITYSLTGLTGMPTETNRVGDPVFVTKALLDPLFYRIGSLSAARGGADPEAMLDLDIDGQARDDGMKDMGADEYK